MPFEVERRGDVWMVSNGSLHFGFYPTKTKAQASAASLNRQRNGFQLSAQELIAQLAERRL